MRGNYRAHVNGILDKIDDSLDNDFFLTGKTFDTLIESRDIIEKMADEVASLPIVEDRREAAAV